MVHHGELGTEGLEYEVEKIVASRTDENGDVEYLVKWTSWPDKDNSWEPAVHLYNADAKVAKFDKEHPDAP